MFLEVKNSFHACNFILKCETLRLLSKELRYYNMKTDRFRLTNHSARSSSNIIIVASQESSLECICFYGVGRISDHAINQFICLRHDKATETRKVGVRKFNGKLHLRKQIKVQLRGMSMSINHKHKFIS